MSDPAAILDLRLRQAMHAALGDALPDDADPLLAPARNAQFGDFQANAAMPLAKALGKNPRDVAAAILEHLDVADIAEPPDVAGPGFINIRLRPGAIDAALEALDTPQLGIVPANPPATPSAGPDVPGDNPHLTVVIDLCGVNLAKQMHVGHIRATVIGDTLARLYERLGHTVFRQNHFGDWGLPIAMVTASVKRAVEAGEIDLDTLDVDHLEHMYKRAQADARPDKRGLAAVAKYDLGPKAQAELEEQVIGAERSLASAKAALVALQSGDEEYRRIWKRISAITLEDCFENCRRLHANVTAEATAGESSYRKDLPEVVADLQARHITEESQGALIIRLDEFGIREPVLIRKSDGGFLYATTDMAAIRRRVQEMGADKVIYAVDARQSLHFKQVFAACRKAGYAHKIKGAAGTDGGQLGAGAADNPQAVHSQSTGDAQLIHAAFGTILGEDNKPFKTRSGENVKLRDLLDEAVDRAEQAVLTKNPDLPPDERRRVAEAVGIGAIKYADLSSDRIRDYVFSFDRMLAFEGNTGPYLLYALVRIHSIFRKAAERFGAEMGSHRAQFHVRAPEEKTIALKLLQYPGVVRAAADSCEPHRLCTYLFELATAFSAFFASCPVLQAEDERTRDARLRLCALTGRVLRDGLETLGLTPLERM